MSEEIELPPPTKKRRVSRKEQSDSSASDGDARSDSSDSSNDSSSESEEKVCVTKHTKVVQAKTQVKKKDNVKVQKKESVCKAEKAKHKSSDENEEVPRI